MHHLEILGILSLGLQMMGAISLPALGQSLSAPLIVSLLTQLTTPEWINWYSTE